MRSRRGGSRSKSKEGHAQAGGGDLVEKRDRKSPERKSPEGAISAEERSESRASKKSGSRHGKGRKRRGKGRRNGKSRSKSNRKSRKSEESPEVGGSSKRSWESVSPERRSEMRVSKGTKRSKRSRSRDGRKSRSRSSRKSKSSRHSRRKHGRHSRHGRRRKRHRGKRSRGKSRSPRSSGRKSRSHAKRSRRTKHGKRHGTSRKRSHSTRASKQRRLHGGKKATEQVGYAGGYACYCLAFVIFAMLILIVCALAAYYTCIIRPKSDTTSTATSEGTGHTGSSSRSTRKHRTRPSPRTTTKPLEPYYCTSSYCKREGQYIGTLLSATTSPCDDFYDHVCTTWVSQHPARSTSTGSLVSQDTMIQMALTRHLLDQLKGAKSRQDIGAAAELHSACVDRIASIPPAAESLNILFSKWSIASWPRGDALHDGEVAVWRFAAELARDFDLATISRVGVSVSPDNLDETVVTLELPRFLLSEADHAKGDAAELFNQAVAEVVGELKASVVGDFAQRLFTVRSAFANVKSLSRNGEDELVVRFDKLSEGLREFLTVLLSDLPRQLTSETNVLLRSAAYFQRDIHGILRSFPFEDTVNYFGFLVIIHLAPFLSHDMRSLRNLFADTVLGHTLGDVAADTPFLCAWLVDQVLPDCVAKAIGMWRHSEGRDVVTREWLDQLEMVFLKRVTDLPWIGELSALLVRYRLKTAIDHSSRPLDEAGLRTRPHSLRIKPDPGLLERL
ncbi:hypothetical protein HPB51_009870 [Rhipicephalus microplus]|uniref:Peptidase M13 N-terminal domain-containing protein n=1 Tax=Rhipicephalus microplus TaxID=6941 RepID=A0A9J6ES04_RHIMP|nr:hypothetical protein HPB51_009870 [Rhipicephalus microplus]